MRILFWGRKDYSFNEWWPTFLIVISREIAQKYPNNSGEIVAYVKPQKRRFEEKFRLWRIGRDHNQMQQFVQREVHEAIIKKATIPQGADIQPVEKIVAQIIAWVKTTQP